ncbi:hypothetical protein SD71_11215 [Cohnella kolymensis]|uniref:HTH cro/C1-type domain-containing protein n=1 Tax=Cohnella kolymensis TaxID=1590652 RepID=A0ABR5A5V0_9BACL|nr:helix-turn-helix transcriptional regulator [Cohnella kolymensis]KIL35935.1 hypothetical protein SD71_11215 [Cohnella kolymensis]
MGVRNTLRDLRFEMKMDQKDFAEFLGVNASTYSRWESNNQQPSMEWALKIASKTGRTVEAFMLLDNQGIISLD